ncbi:MAG: sugar ABC transporter permease [Spirochaetes bacterium RBG_16_67_19]|nr:MAG: sugar ABC transporter permease [Spirochaetes bacterium RBG_16_67_19]
MNRRMRVELFFLDNLIWAIIVLFFGINAFFTPSFLKYENIVNILYHSSILSMLVLGQGIVLITGNIDLSIESTLAFAPAIAMLLATKWIAAGLNPYFSIILTVLIGACVGLANGFFITRIGINSFIHTLSLLIILRGLTLYLVPFAIFKLGPVYTFLGSARMAGKIPVAVLLMFFIFFIMAVILKNTPFGRYLLATGGNPIAGFISGINTKRMVVFAFIISGSLAAVAGLLAAGRQDAVNNSMGKDMVLFTFAGAILGGCSLSGGKGTALGILGGALLLGMINNSLTLIGINVFILYATYGLLIFIAVILDRIRVKLRELVFYQENIRKLRSKANAARL